MDFDDLDDIQDNFGPTPEERRAGLLANAKPNVSAIPLPKGRRFGTEGKMKLLFMHGGGTNEKVSRLQIMNVFKNTGSSHEKWTDIMDFDVWSGPHSVPLEWHAAKDMREMLKHYGPDYWLYWDFDPPYNPNHPKSDWVGYEQTMQALGEFLQERGPYDGICGFDEGGSTAMQAALRAEQGDPAFAKMFNFMILMTTYLPSAFAPLADRRPKVRLRMPVFISWSETDLARPYNTYEEVVLFFEEGQREVVRHTNGHIPPYFLPEMEQTKALAKFLDAMRIGVSWTSSDSATNKEFSGLWMPIARVPATAPSGADRKLLIIHEANLGKLALRDAVASKELSDRCRAYAEVASMTVEDFKVAIAEEGDEVVLESVEYTPEHAEIVWGQPRARLAPETWGVLDPQNVIIDDPSKADSKVLTARSVASNLREQIALIPGTEVGIVGIGHGAFIALQLARILIGGTPPRVPIFFWAVEPPNIMPSAVTSDGLGLLVDCPLRYLIQEETCIGSPWRWEVQTFGPFFQTLFKDRKELCKIILDDFKHC